VSFVKRIEGREGWSATDGSRHAFTFCLVFDDFGMEFAGGSGNNEAQSIPNETKNV
jgi:hypothetical protein